jgi:hypothetical protein
MWHPWGYESGMPSSHATRLSRLGHRIEYRPTSLESLTGWLRCVHQAIVVVRADFLPWADFSGFHAVVVAEMAQPEVAILDSSRDSDPLLVPRDGFPTS